MYLYVYDASVQDRRYEKEIQKIENRLTDLGIAGKIIRLGLFRRADEFIRDEMKHGGATTVVVVGNDATVRQIIDVVAESKVVFGIIPLGQGNRLANLIGVPEGEAACDILSARIVEYLDIGVVNGKRFVCDVSLPAVRSEIICEGKYRLVPQGHGVIDIRNFFAPIDGPPGPVSNPLDGCLELVIRSDIKKNGLNFWKKICGQSVVPFKTLEIKTPESITALMDGIPIDGSRFEFSVEAKSLKVITGKNRKF